MEQLSFCDEIAPSGYRLPAGAVPAEPRGALGRAAGAPLTVCHEPSLMTGPLLVTRPTPWWWSCSSSRPARRPRTIQVLSRWPPAKNRTPSGSKVLKSNSATSLWAGGNKRVARKLRRVAFPGAGSPGLRKSQVGRLGAVRTPTWALTRWAEKAGTSS